MRVIFTGATGFIGRQALPILTQKEFEIHAPFVKAPLEGFPEVSWHQADLHDAAAIGRIFTDVKPTHLLHFAWHVHPKDYKISPENEHWHATTVSLLEAFAKNGGTRSVLAGTAMEYSPELKDEFIREDAQTADHNAYAAGKNATRIDAERIAEEHGISFAWGRIFNLYGPYEAAPRLMPQIINALQENRTPTVSAGGILLDYSYVEDTAGTFAALLDSETKGIVNIASGQAVSLKQIAQTIGEIMGKEKLVADINDVVPPNVPARIVADVSRLTNDVGWNPRFDLRRGLTETIRWWQTQSARDTV